MPTGTCPDNTTTDTKDHRTSADVIEFELREFGAPERRSETDHEEGVITSPGRARLAGGHHHLEPFESDGLHPTLGGPEVAAGEVPVALYLGHVYRTRVTCDQVRATDLEEAACDQGALHDVGMVSSRRAAWPAARSAGSSSTSQVGSAVSRSRLRSLAVVVHAAGSSTSR